jgi:hypothetical protein
MFEPGLRIQMLSVWDRQAGKNKFGIARPDDRAISPILLSPNQVICIFCLMEKLIKRFRNVAYDDDWKRMIDVCSQKPYPLEFYRYSDSVPCACLRERIS